jgi:hypothetical protein
MSKRKQSPSAAKNKARIKAKKKDPPSRKYDQSVYDEVNSVLQFLFETIPVPQKIEPDDYCTGCGCAIYDCDPSTCYITTEIECECARIHYPAEEQESTFRCHECGFDQEAEFRESMPFPVCLACGAFGC